MLATYTNGTNGTTNGVYSPPVIIPPREDLPPFDREAEEAVIGSLLIDPDAVLKVTLDSEDFYIYRLRLVYQAIQALAQRSEPADLVTLSTELTARGDLEEIGGAAYLTGLINATPTSVHVEYYAKIVFNMAMKRRLLTASAEIAKLTSEDNDLGDMLNEAERKIFEVTARAGQDQKKLKGIGTGLVKFYDKLSYIANNPGVIVGMPTGLVELDSILGGLQRSDMITLAGRPGMGKTSLALSIAMTACKNYGRKVALFSLEMSEEQLIQRLLASESGIDTQRLRLGRLNDEDWPSFYQAMGTLEKLTISIDDTAGLTVMDLRSRARRLAVESGLDFIIIDYLQLLSVGGKKRPENRTQEISFISRQIKEMARELNVPVLALSQLSRSLESRADKRPMLSDLRESGAIEQDSDVVLFVYRDEVYNPDTEFPGIADIIIGKHRSGPTGAVSVLFKKSLATFVDLEVRKIKFAPYDNPAMPNRSLDGGYDD